MNRLVRTTLTVAILALASSAEAQSPAPGPVSGARQVLRGFVHSPDGAPIAGANVFILETLEGVLTGPDGHFAIATSQPGNLTLIVKRLGFENIQREIAPAQRDSIDVALKPGTVALAPITVQAGAYTAGEERGATLTPLEVVTTPGTAADINRTIQTLPGVQTVDEGTALFVRGGDYTETKVFLNEAPLLNPVQLLSPSGTFIGTVDPFLLDGIFFSSGGFGARYGDALSAVAGLRTRAAASHTTATAGAGLAALSADIGIPVTSRFTIRAAANRFDLQPFFDVNGSVRRFDPAPHGRDLSGSAIWTYHAGAELKAFVVDQTNLLGIGVDDPAFSGSYDNDTRSRHAVVNWRHVIGSFSPTLSVSQSRLQRDESFGAFQLSSDLVQRQIFTQTDWQAAADLVVRAGGEVERLASAINGSIPASGADNRPGARTTLAALDRVGHRSGAFAEIDWKPGNRWRFIPGIRTDRSDLTDARTVDTRLNVAFRLAPLITITGAWGIYHQIPDPLFFASTQTSAVLPPMRARQVVIGLQLGEGDLTLRVEAYAKRYRDLAQQSRDHMLAAGGRGRSHGVDFFLRSPMPFGIQSRSVLSIVSADRTDPSTGAMARAPYDISSSQIIILERTFPWGLRAGAAFRSATGKPITPVIAAQYDPVRDIYVPTYGAPMSERLPSFRRVDLSVSQYRPIGRGWSGVFYLSLSNILDRENIYDYRYSRDYSERSPVRSIFNRAVYFGASLLRQ